MDEFRNMCCSGYLRYLGLSDKEVDDCSKTIIYRTFNRVIYYISQGLTFINLEELDNFSLQ